AQKLVTLRFKNKALKEVFKDLYTTIGVKFVYSSNSFDANQMISGNFSDLPLDQVLKHILSNLDVTYTIEDNTVVIKRIEAGAQQQILKGRINDETGKPMANVIVRTSSSGEHAVSDDNGKFSISVHNDQFLLFNMLGYQTRQIEVDGRKEYVVNMVPATEDLEEVVVSVAYGEVKKSELTGSVGVVNMEELTKAPVSNFEQALAGRIAGVQVSSNEGQPGSDMNIVVRGGNSLTQSNSPLYVVDGFPIEDFASASLNSDDIASITVLKDADATSVYGSRAANGVIVIETKKGIADKPSISYHGY